MMWFPQSYQLRPGKNPSYLNSVWIGFTTPLIGLPVIVWRVLLRPLLFGTIDILKFVLFMPVIGLMGRLVSVDEPMPRIHVYLATMKPRDGQPKP